MFVKLVPPTTTNFDYDFYNFADLVSMIKNTQDASYWLDDFSVFETKDGDYILSLPIPGFSKEEIKAEIIEDEKILITAEKKNEPEHDNEGKYHRRMVTNYRKLILLPKGTLSDNITISLENGVLSIKIPHKPKKFLEIK